MHFRYYSAGMGRFMRPDNIPGNLMNPQSWNKYAYANNNPVNFNDPTGHIAGGGNIFGLQPPPGAYWDGGIGSWWLNEAKGSSDADVVNGIFGAGSAPLGSFSQSASNGSAGATFSGQDYSLSIDPSYQPRQTLIANPVKPPGPSFNAIRWSLRWPSKSGGIIVQEIRLYDRSRTLRSLFWEGWVVPKGSKYTTWLNKLDYDDTFRDYRGWKVEASARFYEGTTSLPVHFIPNSRFTSAHRLPSTIWDPQLAFDNATATVFRDWIP
jgi:hypothetical protein